MAKPGRPGAGKGKKRPVVGSGGRGKRALEGRGPTPKAEDRSWHVAGKRKAAQERLEAARARHAPKPAPPARAEDGELVTGRNSVVEALRARVPGSALYLAARIEQDERVKEAIRIAAQRDIPVLEITRPELDRMSGPDAVHQGIALRVPPYEYAHPDELLERATAYGQTPLLVALDGVTDPRNLGAIIRSIAAFGGHGAIIPQRRSVGMTAAAWKTSAGAAAHVPVARAVNLTQALKELKSQGVFVVGLDAGGDVALPGLHLATDPLVLVVGSEGKGLSRLVAQTCDAIASIPIASRTESLNAGVAAGVALYEVARLRAESRG